MIDKKRLGETSVPHHNFFAFPIETLWDSDPYFLYIIFFKGLVLFVRGRFSKYFRTPESGSFTGASTTLLPIVVTDNLWRWEA